MKVCGNCNEGQFLGLKFSNNKYLMKYFGFDICKTCEPVLLEQYNERPQNNFNGVEPYSRGGHKTGEKQCKYRVTSGTRRGYYNG